jgi:hypothetical protein
MSLDSLNSPTRAQSLEGQSIMSSLDLPEALSAEEKYKMQRAVRCIFLPYNPLQETFSIEKLKKRK